MKHEDDYFIINYNENDKAYVSQLIKVLNENMIKIMCFFCLTELKQKKVINIWNNINEYEKYISPYVGEYQEWMVADTFDNNINIISYDLCLSNETHKNCNMSNYKKIIIHEFVHACQQEINPNAKNVIWFWEALATNLSEQEYSLINIPYTKSELINNFKHLKYAYPVSYTIGRYLLENYTHEHILDYIKNPNLLLDDTENILEETNAWVKR